MRANPAAGVVEYRGDAVSEQELLERARRALQGAETTPTGRTEAFTRPMSDVQPEARADGEILVAAKGGGIAFLGRVFAWGARLVLAVLLAHTLDADGYGLYNLALIIATVVASFPSSASTRRSSVTWPCTRGRRDAPACGGASGSASACHSC